MSDLIKREDAVNAVEMFFEDAFIEDAEVHDLVYKINHIPAASQWHRVEDGLPKESNCYIVYLRQGTEMKTPEWMGGEPLSYVTEMGFEKGQMLWRDGDDAYNASLSLVDTANEFHVTHWMEKPEPPKEDA